MGKSRRKAVDGSVAARSAEPVVPRWWVVRYAPVSLFSLRSTFSTSKGGKTLLLPTPYAAKMALIDAVFRLSPPENAGAAARAMFDRVKDRRIRFRPPAECVVQNTFVKIRQEERGASSGQYVPTIAYRELVFFAGTLELAIDAAGWSDADDEALADAAAHVNYFGKRGSFFQFMGMDVLGELPAGYTLAHGDDVSAIPLGYGITQYLDDFGPDLCKAKDGFERISTFHDGSITVGKHRVLTSTLVPYQRVEATRSYTRYKYGLQES